MQLFLFGWLPLITAAATKNLRRSTDLSIELRSKHGAEEQTSHSSDSVVKIELTNYKGMEYYGPITLGGQDLMAIYDTGSFDIMAVSDHCKGCMIPSKLKVYQNASSNTFKKGASTDTYEHHFAGGKLMARLDYDTVEMGSDPTVKAENMPIWQVTETTLPQWVEMPDDCKFTTIVGLGFGENAPDSPGALPPIVQLLERTGTRKFAICLQKGASNPGYVVLNPSYDTQSADFSSMFRKLSVIGQKHWAVKHGGVSYFNGHYTDRRCDRGECVAIVDSGTSLIGVPGIHMAFISEFASRINNDCSNLDKLPDLNFKLGDHDFPLPASAYVIKYQGKCYAAFMQLTMMADQGLVWVLGLPFLRHYYTLWDRQGPSLYIAEQGDKCEPNPISNVTVDLAHSTSSLAPMPVPTIGDVREARLPSWMPQGSEKITI